MLNFALGSDVEILFASTSKKIGTESPPRLAGNAQKLGFICRRFFLKAVNEINQRWQNKNAS